MGTGSVEILVTVHDKRLERFVETDIGANGLSVDGSKNKRLVKSSFGEITTLYLRMIYGIDSFRFAPRRF